MATFFTVPRSERRRIFKSMQVAGRPDRIKDFLQIFTAAKAEGKANP
jgi:hypothetical protein